MEQLAHRHLLGRHHVALRVQRPPLAQIFRPSALSLGEVIIGDMRFVGRWLRASTIRQTTERLSCIGTFHFRLSGRPLRNEISLPYQLSKGSSVLHTEPLVAQFSL